MEQCSVLSRNKLSSHERSLRKLRHVQLSGRGSLPTPRPHGLLEKAKPCRQEKIDVARESGEGWEGYQSMNGFNSSEKTLNAALSVVKATADLSQSPSV